MKKDEHSTLISWQIESHGIESVCVRENVDRADNIAAVWGEIDGLDDTGGGKYRFCEDFRELEKISFLENLFWKKSKFCCLFYVKEAQIYPHKNLFLKI